MRQLKRLVIWWLALNAFVLGIAHPLRVRSIRGMGLRGLKSISEAVSPFAAAAGGITAWLACALGTPAAGALAAAGAWLSARYIYRVRRQPVQDPGGILATGEQKMGEHQQRALPRRHWQFHMPAPTCEPDWQRDQMYHVPADRERTMPPLLFDLWQPPPATPASGIALIYIHGGGYFTSEKDFGTRTMFRHLACQGHVIMDIDYRLAPGAMLYDMLSDVKHAVSWMKTNSGWLNVNPDRIVLMGGSAGAHLAALAAYAPNQPGLTPLDLLEADLSIHGLISYYGILDLGATMLQLRQIFGAVPDPLPFSGKPMRMPLEQHTLRLGAWMRGVEPAGLRKHMRENMDLFFAGVDQSFSRLLGGSPEQIPEEYRLASVLTYAGTNSPATLLVQGEHDSFVPNAPAQELFDRLRQAGVPVASLTLPETEHTFDLFLPQFAPAAQTALHAVERFLAFLR